MKNILITGGAGFIGTNLTKYLLAKGNKVICLDNFYSSKMQKIMNFFKHPNFEFVNHDVTEPFDFPVDEIYHLAAPASPIQYQKNPIYTTKTIVIGTLNVLECARKNKAKVLIASTSEVYGEPQQHPQGEEYRGNVNINGPRACYDESKRCAETLTSDYKRFHSIDSKIVRIFNTYGPYMEVDDGRVVSEFIISNINNKAVKIFGSGIQTRSFCYIDDLIDGLIKMMNSDQSGPLNLGNPYEISIIELSKKIASVMNTTHKLVFEKLPLNDPSRRNPDISMARKYLNWEPKVSIEEGLGKTFEYFSELLKKDSIINENISVR